MGHPAKTVRYRDPSLEGGGEPPGSWGEDRSVPGSHDPSPCPALSTGSRVAQMLSGSRWEVSGALSIAVSAGPARPRDQDRRHPSRERPLEWMEGS